MYPMPLYYCTILTVIVMNYNTGNIIPVMLSQSWLPSTYCDSQCEQSLYGRWKRRLIVMWPVVLQLLTILYTWLMSTLLLLIQA